MPAHKLPKEEVRRRIGALRAGRAAGMSQKQIAAELGISEVALHAHARAARIVGKVQREKRHGIPARWQAGCRCDICVAAMREYKRAERESSMSRLNPGQVGHGATAYTYHGCRCEICLAAAREVLRARQVRTRRTARNHGRRWTGAEAEVVKRTDLTIEEIATILGRTYAAVDNYRRYLDRHPRN